MAEDEQLVIFKLENEDYGLPISKVQEINCMIEVTRIPQTPEFIEGIINLRRRVIPVLDLRKRFGLSSQEYQENTRIMVVDVEGQTVGLIVDAVREVVWIAGDCIEPAPAASVIDTQLVQAIGKLEDRLVIILDIDRIISSKEIIMLKSIVAA